VLIVVVVEEVHGEDGLATVVSGLVLGCLLVLPDHQARRCCPEWRCVDLTCQAAGEGQTMSPSQRRVGGRKKKGSNKAVEQNGGDTGNRTLPTARMSFWNVGQSPRVCIDDGRIVLRLSSYSCTMCTKESANRRGSQIWTGAMISVFRHITVSISMTALFCVREACNKNHMPNYEQGGHQAS
jgi:hypothetical protein